ncbi:nitroreductase family protein [Photobacterium lipolyticum]|uniref:NAD(P)H-dependent oxidoreductase n=1 Tax=Photobacterium lipolyticum TaxID=266810 RepID=A0A2T3MWX3_9GAMM|nr:nitroreductase family protein [Photobacterium lipolyticum]PSW04388.1 NAD(P)H-dependent oxidoreductase [Photobacterium lipolyticum]
MTHQIISDLNSRYTTKRFDPSKKVSQEDLDVILEAIRLSASSINSQPWKFIVIESDKAKQRMHDTFINKFQFNQPHVFSASHIILFAHNPAYTRANYEAVVDKGIEDKRTKPEDKESAFGGFVFAELNTDETGNTEAWTKAQTYIALGNTLHTVARLNIDSTPMEGIDSEMISKEFAAELDGHVCHVALAIGYRDENTDYNAAFPKSRLAMEDIVVKL